MSPTTPAKATSDDALLDGRVRLRQFTSGYRVAIDPVFLAAAVPARAGDRVLDVGTGVGAAALCLAFRVPGCWTAGIDHQPELVRLAAQNIVRNGFENDLAVAVADISRTTSLRPASFDHVMANPPHLDSARCNPSPDPARAAATVESAPDLRTWVSYCLAMVRPRGSLTLIHRTDRLDDLLTALHARAGAIVVFPLWPESDGKRPAKRVIVQARKDVASPTRLARGLSLHPSGEGRFTAAADAILRQGRQLALEAPNWGMMTGCR